MPVSLLSRTLNICLFSTLLSFTAIPSATAQIAAWPFDGPSFGTPAADLAAAAAKIPAEKFAEATILYEEARYTIDAAGRVTERRRLVYRIETAAAVQNWAEAAVFWEAFYQNQPTIHARVIEMDGHVVELDPSTLTDVPARNQGDGTYSDARIHKGPLPALNAGSIVEEETELVDKEPFFSGGGV